MTLQLQATSFSPLSTVFCPFAKCARGGLYTRLDLLLEKFATHEVLWKAIAGLLSCKKRVAVFVVNLCVLIASAKRVAKLN